MTEFIRNARLPGWPDYKSGGKFAALLLIALMLYWFARKELKNRYFVLGVYTTVMAVCCICPLTAAMLMSYQTKFYDYQWIWNLVPVTIFLALAGTLLWTEWMQQCMGQKGRKWKQLGITLGLLGIVYLSGRMGNTIWDTEKAAAQRQETAKVLEAVTEKGQETDITLWAPRGIMEYARALDGNIRLPYGRNMWDISLNAYSYDTYSTDQQELYAWMCQTEEAGDGQAAADHTVTGTDCMDIASKLGVTHVLLPGNILPETLEELEEYTETEAEEVEGYYLLRIQ